MGLIWKQELTINTLQDFADEFIKPTYLMAYKATLDPGESKDRSIDTLTRVFALREAYKEDPEDIPPEKAIADVLEQQLSKTQFANFHNSSITPSESELPSRPELIELVDHIVERANAEMPRYAPVYSGTAGTLIILVMVAVIVAAIALICVNPFKRADSEHDNSSVIYVAAGARADPDYLVELSSEIRRTDTSGRMFNGGNLPVLVELSGPDVAQTKCVSASDINGQIVELYQYDKDRYCYFSSDDILYCTYAVANNGNAAYSYCSIYDSKLLSDSDLAPETRYAEVTHGEQVVLSLFPSGTVSSAVIANVDDEVSQSDLGASSLKIVGPEEGFLDVNSSNTALTYTASNNVGLHSVALTLCDSAGEAHEYTIPLLVSNNAPTVDDSQLSAEILHTPTRSAAYAGHLSASDADGDEPRFTLVDTFNCSVMLSGSGKYIASIDKGYSGSLAYFTFTVSDGLITTDPQMFTFTLKNNLLSQLEYSMDIVYYGGDYFFPLPIPAVDDDGDPLTWTIITPLADGLTANGSEIEISADSSELLYHPGNALDRDTTELISLICTDGWVQSPTVTYSVNISENKPPVAAPGNSTEISLETAETICTLNLIDDFELDHSVISGVKKAVGGSVAEQKGWDTLTFTFTPDGTETDCYVILTVQDTVTEKTSDIRFTINRV